MVDEVAAPALTPTAAPAATPEPQAAPAAENPSPAAVDDPAADYMLDVFDIMQRDEDDVTELPAAPVETSPQATAEAIPPQATTPVAAVPQVAPVQTAAAPTVPATTPAQAPVVAAQPAAQTPVSPPSPAAQAVAPAPGGEIVGNSFDQIAEGMVKQKEQFVQALAEQQYKLSQADLDELLDKPEIGYAKLAARAQIEATASVLKVLSQQMPVYVAGLMQARTRNAEAEDSFWNANPSLDRKAHRETAAQVMKTVRQMHPQMDAATFIKQVGAITAGLVGAQPRAPAQTPQGQVQTPGRIVRPTNGAFQPAGHATAPASAHPQPQLNSVEAAFELFRLDETGAFDT